MATPNTRFSTVSGAYYVGMTRNQAKNKKEFDRIDTNHDKKLQGHEICDERDTEALKMRGDKDKTVGVLSGAMCLAPATSATGIGLPIAIGGTIILGGAALVADIFMDDGKEAMKETQKYRQKHKLDANF